MFHLPSPCSLVGRVWQQRDVARALDRFRQHALVSRTVTRDAPRQNLAALRKVVEQQPDIFEIDQVHFVDAETANTPPVHATSAAAATHWPSILIVVAVVSATASAPRAVFV